MRAPSLAAPLHQSSHMLVFRSLTIGLLGACLYLLGNLQVLTDYADIDPPPRVIEAAPVVGNNITVVDVAPHVRASQIAGLVRLHEREQIVAVNDEQVGNSLAAATQVVEVLRRGTKLLDLTVTGDAGVRRVLVIVH